MAPLFCGAAIAIIPWIFYLGFELPERSTAQHYNLAWVGFDLFLVFTMARTAILAWRGGGRSSFPQ